jgi:transketolase
MRNAFAAAFTALAADVPELVLLSGDIGNRLFDDFKGRYPERFFNCGVAEANMVSVAAGLALGGLRPVTYTIASFMTTRCFEQLRVDVCYQRQSVVIVGVGAGLGYASNGATHQSTEDVALLRTLPGLTIVCPGDPLEVGPALRAAVALGGPVYLRLGKKGEPAVHERLDSLTLGRGLVVREGRDVCLLGCGTALPVAVAAADALASDGLSAEVVSFHTVKPLDEALLAGAFERFAVVATVEEHTLIGGLGGAVAEWLADGPPRRGRLCRCGLPDAFVHEAGGQDYYRAKHGLTGDGVARRVKAALGDAA